MADDDIGASTTYPGQCGMLQQGGFVVIEHRPCKIMDKCIQIIGKHGQAKIHLIGIDVFTGEKLKATHPSTHNMDVPNVQRKQYQLLDITDNGFLSLVSVDGGVKRVIKVPEGKIGTDIEHLFRVEKKDVYIQILAAMGEDMVVDSPASDYL